MPKLYLAVISDLHIGHNARAKDLCPHDDYKGIKEKYVQKFINFIKSEHIKADYLIVPGDITGKAHPLEFELASEAIINIGNAFNIPEEKILFVPGNHDKDWSIPPPDEGDNTGIRVAQTYESLKKNNWIFDRILRRSSNYMLSEESLAIWNFDDLVVVGYNSSWHDNSIAKIHHGLIKEESLKLLDEILKIDQLKQKVKVFLVHHHPIQYSNPIPDQSDHSIMTNAENLMTLLTKFKFDLLLHGHKHVPHFNTHNINSSFPLVILGAGSFSSQLDYSYNGHASNLFHLLEVDGRDNKTNCIYGTLNSWSFLTGHGWRPSSKHDGIMPKKPFGTHTTQFEIKNKLTPIIQTNFQISNYVRWIDLVGKDNELKYLPAECVCHVLKDIGEELGAEYLGDSPDNAMLLLPKKDL